MKRKETEYEVEFILASAIAEAALLPAGLGDIAVIESKLIRVLDLDLGSHKHRSFESVGTVVCSDQKA